MMMADAKFGLFVLIALAAVTLSTGASGGNTTGLNRSSEAHSQNNTSANNDSTQTAAENSKTDSVNALQINSSNTTDSKDGAEKDETGHSREKRSVSLNLNAGQILISPPKPEVSQGNLELSCNAAYKKSASIIWSVNGLVLREGNLKEVDEVKGDIQIKTLHLKIPSLEAIPLKADDTTYEFECAANIDGTVKTSKTIINHKVSDNCLTDAECSQRNAKCIENKCKCKEPYLVQLESNHVTCRPPVGLNKSCTYTEQCVVPGTRCSAQGLCTCTPDSSLLRQGNPRCEIPVGDYGSYCQNDGQCAKIRGKCVIGLCLCEWGAIPQNGVCGPPVMTCSGLRRLVKSGVILSKDHHARLLECNQKENNTLSNETLDSDDFLMLEDTDDGHNSTKDAKIKNSDSNDASSIKNIGIVISPEKPDVADGSVELLCNATFKKSALVSWTLNGVPLREPVSNEQQEVKGNMLVKSLKLKIPHLATIPLQNKNSSYEFECVADIDGKPTKSKTIVKHHVSDNCVNDADCVHRNAKCMKDKCQCAEPFIPLKSNHVTCRLPVGLNSPCLYSEQCIVPGTVCGIGGVCSCLNKDSKACMVVKGAYASSCSSDADCAKIKGKCIVNLCMCSSGSIDASGVCSSSAEELIKSSAQNYHMAKVRLQNSSSESENTTNNNSSESEKSAANDLISNLTAQLSNSTDTKNDDLVKNTTQNVSSNDDVKNNSSQKLHKRSENSASLAKMKAGQMLIDPPTPYVSGGHTQLTCNAAYEKSASIIWTINGLPLDESISRNVKVIKGENIHMKSYKIGIRHIETIPSNAENGLYEFECVANIDGKVTRSKTAVSYKVSDSCKTDSECKTRNAKCVENHCKCSDPFVIQLKSSHVTCRIPVGLDSPCVYTEQCVVRGTSCDSKGFCSCPSDGKSSKDKRNCIVKEGGYGSPCQTDAECAKINGKCIINLCVCDGPNVEEGGTCIAAVPSDNSTIGSKKRRVAGRLVQNHHLNKRHLDSVARKSPNVKIESQILDGAENVNPTSSNADKVKYEKYRLVGISTENSSALNASKGKMKKLKGGLHSAACRVRATSMYLVLIALFIAVIGWSSFIILG